jgi:hypothetical protein
MIKDLPVLICRTKFITVHTHVYFYMYMYSKNKYIYEKFFLAQILATLTWLMREMFYVSSQT